jgi:hypothetical protein
MPAKAHGARFISILLSKRGMKVHPRDARLATHAFMRREKNPSGIQGYWA